MGQGTRAVNPGLFLMFRDSWQVATPQNRNETRGNGEFFWLLVCELFRAHEMHSWLEVTEMLECNVDVIL